MIDTIARGIVANNASYLGTPIATYTHNANKEVVVSAVDVSTDIFTSVGHGLSNNDKLYVIGNIDAGLIYIIDKLVGGITVGTCYYVVNVTADNFQLSLTSGGAAIDLTTNANMNLTKWHFERRSIDDITISNLPTNLKRCKVRSKGRGLGTGNLSIIPNSVPYAAEWVNNGNPTSYSSGWPVSCSGGRDLSLYIESIIDYSGLLKLLSTGLQVKSSTITTVGFSQINYSFFTPKYSNADIVSVTLMGLTPANGTIVEVFKA